MDPRKTVGSFGQCADRGRIREGADVQDGQSHVHRYFKPLLERIEIGQIDPSQVITNKYKLSDAPKAYKQFLTQRDEWVKVVLKP